MAKMDLNMEAYKTQNGFSFRLSTPLPCTTATVWSCSAAVSALW